MPYKDYEKTKQNARDNYYFNKEKKLKWAREYYYKNWELKQKQRAEWIKNNPEKFKRSVKKWETSEKGKISRQKTREKYRNDPDNKLKRLARYTTRNAIRRGVIIKPDRCQDCKIKTDKLHAHHFKGYSKDNFLKVEWLCVKCHNKKHYEKTT